MAPSSRCALALLTEDGWTYMSSSAPTITMASRAFGTGNCGGDGCFWNGELRGRRVLWNGEMRLRDGLRGRESSDVRETCCQPCADCWGGGCGALHCPKMRPHLSDVSVSKKHLVQLGREWAQQRPCSLKSGRRLRFRAAFPERIPLWVPHLEPQRQRRLACTRKTGRGQDLAESLTQPMRRQHAFVTCVVHNRAMLRSLARSQAEDTSPQDARITDLLALGAVLES